jgi:outer membrane protein TolC
MTSSIKKLMIMSASTLILTGCVANGDIEEYKIIDAGFSTVSDETRKAVNKQTVWIQNQEEAEALSKRVHGLVHKRTIDVNTAIQVALLNNKGLQASYADLGMSAAEAWQQTMLENPKISIGILGIAHPELGAFRAIEGMLATNILALATRDKRIAIADTRFRQAQLKAALATLKIASATRKAWINAVSAFENVYYLNQAQLAADAASILAKKLGESGALPKAGQAREHAFYSELTGQKAKARLAAKLAKEQLTKIMGLWGSEVDYFVPDKLPQYPRKLQQKKSIESEALNNRVDLQIAKLELEAVAKSYGLTKATRYVTDLEIIAGFEKEREIDDDSIETIITPQVEFEFVIPIFDTGEARMRKAELAYMKAANLLAEKAINIRSEARSAYTAYHSTYQIARHYRNSVLPLRTEIETESLLTYNGMITNTFELLADTRAKISTIIQSVQAKREFWIADADLTASIYGSGGLSDSNDNGDMTAITSDRGGH